MPSNRRNFPKGDVILVATGNQALATGSGVNIVPASGTGVNGLADGQLGVIAVGDSGTLPAGQYLEAAETVSDAPRIRIVQGTPNSSDVTGVDSLNAIQDQLYVKSPIIDGTKAVAFSAKLAAVGKNDSHFIDNTTPADETRYSFSIGFNGLKKDRRYSTTALELYSPSFLSPDYTTLALTSSLDHLYKNLVVEINKNSKVLNFQAPLSLTGTKDLIAFGIDKDGAASGGVALSAISVGTVITVLTIDGVNYNYTADADFVATVADWIANGGTDIVNATKILPVNPTGAGAAADVDGIMIMATDGDRAQVKDTFKLDKHKLYVGLSEGFDAATEQVNVARPLPPQGEGLIWKLQYDERAGLNIYTQQNEPSHQEFIIPPNYINTGSFYTAYVIENVQTHDVLYSHTSINPIRVIILIENTTTGTTPATTLASLNAILGPWLNSCPIKEKFETTGTAPNFFI